MVISVLFHDKMTPDEWLLAGLHRPRNRHHVLRLAELGPGLRGVGEGEPGGVDDPVIADQSHGHLGGLAAPLPAISEL